MKCIDCLYFWKEQGDNHAYCHYFANDGYAPCEVDEPEETEDD